MSQKTRWQSMKDAVMIMLEICGYITLGDMKSIGLSDAGMVMLREISDDFGFAYAVGNKSEPVFFIQDRRFCGFCHKFTIETGESFSQCTGCKTLSADEELTSKMSAKRRLVRDHGKRSKIVYGSLGDGAVFNEVYLAAKSILLGWITESQIDTYSEVDQKKISEKLNELLSYEAENSIG